MPMGVTPFILNISRRASTHVGFPGRPRPRLSVGRLAAGRSVPQISPNELHAIERLATLGSGGLRPIADQPWLDVGSRVLQTRVMLTKALDTCADQRPFRGVGG